MRNSLLPKSSYDNITLIDMIIAKINPNKDTSVFLFPNLVLIERYDMT